MGLKGVFEGVLVDLLMDVMDDVSDVSYCNIPVRGGMIG